MYSSHDIRGLFWYVDLAAASFLVSAHCYALHGRCDRHDVIGGLAASVALVAISFTQRAANGACHQGANRVGYGPNRNKCSLSIAPCHIATRTGWPSVSQGYGAQHLLGSIPSHGSAMANILARDRICGLIIEGFLFVSVVWPHAFHMKQHPQPSRSIIYYLVSLPETSLQFIGSNACGQVLDSTAYFVM